MNGFIRQLRPAIVAVAVFTAICGLIYPLVVTAIGQTAFNDKANGSLIERDGVVIGSELIGQSFWSPQYFQPRPSAAGAGYDGAASSGSNLGPLSPDLLAAVQDRSIAYRQLNGLTDNALVPIDAVTTSGSGLDPHISIANAMLQAPRVADVRGIDLEQVVALVDANTEGRGLGIFGEPGVNVLALNVALNDSANG